MKRVTGTTALLVAVAMLVGGSFVGAAVAAQSQPKAKITFTFGSPVDVDSMNQFTMVSTGYTIHSMAYDLLLGFSPTDLSPVPDVATQVPTMQNGGISKDGLTWTFHIRSGMKWSDGVPLTAHDVAYTYNRIIQEHQGCCFSYLKLAKSITAPNDTTLIIQAAAPTSAFYQIYAYIYPEHIWSKISTTQAKTYENFPGVTSGPFHPIVWKKGQYMTLKANPNYWAGAPHVDEIVFRVFNNQDAEIQALQNGEIDFVDSIKPNLYNSLQHFQGVTTHQAVSNQLDDIAMNTGDTQGNGNPALRDPLFRRALSMAIDKQTLVNRVMLGYATPGTTIVTPFTAAYHATVPPSQVIPFDIAGANKLLDQAGYVDTNNNGIRNLPNGGPDINLRYYLASSVDSTTATAQFVQSWFKQIGIATTVKSYSDNKLTDIEQSGNYDIVHWDWFPDPDPDFILSVLTCAQRPHLAANGQNVGGLWSDTYYCNKTYDQEYAQQKTLTSVPQRAALIKKMQLQAYNAAPYIILWYGSDLQAYRSDWTGFTPQPSPNGDLLAAYGNTTWRSVRPVAGSSGQTQTRGIPVGVWIGIVVGLIVVIGAYTVVRRRRPDEDAA